MLPVKHVTKITSPKTQAECLSLFSYVQTDAVLSLPQPGRDTVLGGTVVESSGWVCVGGGGDISTD